MMKGTTIIYLKDPPALSSLLIADISAKSGGMDANADRWVQTIEAYSSSLR
jgi:hypothetical protein